VRAIDRTAQPARMRSMRASTAADRPILREQHATARRRTPIRHSRLPLQNCLRPWRQVHRLYLPHRSTPPDAFARDHCRWQVSWLAGRRFGPPSQRPDGPQWHSWPSARRLQLRGQLRNCTPGSDARTAFPWLALAGTTKASVASDLRSVNCGCALISAGRTLRA
jgi:hypothetical protein